MSANPYTMDVTPETAREHGLSGHQAEGFRALADDPQTSEQQLRQAVLALVGGLEFSWDRYWERKDQAKYWGGKFGTLEDEVKRLHAAASAVERVASSGEGDLSEQLAELREALAHTGLRNIYTDEMPRDFRFTCEVGNCDFGEGREDAVYLYDGKRMCEACHSLADSQYDFERRQRDTQAADGR